MNLPNITQATPQSSGAVSVRLVQTEAFSYLLEAVSNIGDIGFIRASSEPFARIPGLLVDEDAVLTIAVTAGATIPWGDQLQDWVTPFNAVDDQGGPVRTMFSLGNGPIAVDFAQFETLLERVKEHLLVAYILPGCVGVARYRWNARLIGTMNQLYEATQFYESLTARATDRDSISNTSENGGVTRTAYGRMHADGSVELSQ
jgi:hypothetical protein